MQGKPINRLFRERAIGFRWLILLVALGGSFSFRLLAQPVACTPGQETLQAESRLQQQLDNLLERNPNIPGVLVHVDAPKLCLSWSGAAGVNDLASGRPLQPEQTFRIASNTKTFTASAILRLVEEGKLDLKSSLHEVLPENQDEMLQAGGYSTDRMTLEQVLTHTSGLFDHAATREYMRDIFANPHRQWKREDQIRYSAQFGTPLGAPGTTYSYADTGFVILGGLVEQKTGKSMAAAFRELLGFARLGLDATWMESVEPKPDGSGARAHQYLGEADTYDWNPSMDLYGGGGLVTSSRDLALFIRSLLEGKVFEKASTLHTMLNTVITPKQGGYRMGIEKIEVSGVAGWGHTGFWNTFAYHFPADDITLAGSINQQDTILGRRWATTLVALVQELQAN